MKKQYRNMVFSAVCLALALVLPMITGQIPEVGNLLSPMHIPALLCGFICGPVWGAVMGGVAPLLRSAIWGMPPFPMKALPMAFELLVYGLTCGILYRLFPKKNGYIYLSLIISMLSGRIVAAVVKVILYAVIGGTPYTFAMFISGSFAEALPGIVLHIAVIPPIVMALRRAGLIDDGRKTKNISKTY